MSAPNEPDDPPSDRAEIVRLLDDRYRLREDPERRSDLDRTHTQLRELLRRSRSDPANKPTEEGEDAD
jgi:hypothetical protein